MRLWRSRQGRTVIIFFVLLVVMVVATQSGWLAKVPTTSLPRLGLYSVTQYIDGDTIAVDMNGGIETIRFIGVDTPETHRPDTPVQCYGPDAAAYTKKTISTFGKVRLQADPLDTNRDRYGRLLRYVYLPDGTLLDEQLIRQGYGFAYLGFPFSRADQFAADQKSAQANKAGLWRACQPSVNQYGGYSSNPLE